MAKKLLYNVIAYEATTAEWAADNTIHGVNDILIDSTTGVIKKGNGVNKYSALSDLGALQVATWADISGKPTTFAPEIGTTATKAAAGNHDHAIVEDAASGLAAAANLQALAIALSARIKVLEDAAV